MVFKTGIKKSIAMVLAFMMLIMLPCISTAEETSGEFEGIYWELDEEGTLILIGYGKEEVPESGPWEAYKDKVKAVIYGDGIIRLNKSFYREYSNLASMQDYDVIIRMSEKSHPVIFDTTEGLDGAVMMVDGEIIMGDYNETTISIENGCVKSEESRTLIPVKPGEDTITVTVKHNGKRVVSEDTYTILVLEADEEETTELETNPQP